MSDGLHAWAFTWTFVGHGHNTEEALEDVLGNFEAELTADGTEKIEYLGLVDPEPTPWAIYCPSEEAWWNDDTGWGDLASARRFDTVSVERDKQAGGPHLVQPDAMYVKIGSED